MSDIWFISSMLIRFEEAEHDCTEALNLDDRYIKAYSRRVTARKELKKYKESLEGMWHDIWAFSCFCFFFYLKYMEYSFCLFGISLWLWSIWCNEYSLTADAEFAMSLEPQNQEIKKQYSEAKSLYEKVSESLYIQYSCIIFSYDALHNSN